LVSLAEIILALVLVFVGVLAISLLATILGFLPAIVAAVIVYYVAGQTLLYAGIAFVVVAFAWALVKHR
jgi:hypothetical protein